MENVYAPIEKVGEYNQLQMSIDYVKEENRLRGRGIYLRLKPVKLTRMKEGYDLVSCTLYSQKTKENGLIFHLDSLKRRNQKKEIQCYKTLELHKDEIAELYNRFDRNEITAFIYSKF